MYFKTIIITTSNGGRVEAGREASLVGQGVGAVVPMVVAVAADMGPDHAPLAPALRLDLLQ
jgi:hypothetical protein